jgi:hypothetical protein
MIYVINKDVNRHPKEGGMRAAKESGVEVIINMSEKIGRPDAGCAASGFREWPVSGLVWRCREDNRHTNDDREHFTAAHRAAFVQLNIQTLKDKS